MSLKSMKLLSLLVVLSLFLVACNGAAQPTEIPQNTDPPTDTSAPESPTSEPAPAVGSTRCPWRSQRLPD